MAALALIDEQPYADIADALGISPVLRIADAASADATPFTATVRGGATGPEIVTGMTSAPMVDVASGVQSVVQYVSSQLNLPQHPPADTADHHG